MLISLLEILFLLNNWPVCVVDLEIYREYELCDVDVDMPSYNKTKQFCG